MQTTNDTPQLVFARHDIAILVQPLTQLVIVVAVGIMNDARRVILDNEASRVGILFFDRYGCRKISDDLLIELALSVRHAWKQI